MYEKDNCQVAPMTTIRMREFAAELLDAADMADKLKLTPLIVIKDGVVKIFIGKETSDGVDLP